MWHKNVDKLFFLWGVGEFDMSVIGGLQRNGVTMVTQFYDILNYVE
jgi:hypothetical protein